MGAGSFRAPSGPDVRPVFSTPAEFEAYLERQAFGRLGLPMADGVVPDVDAKGRGSCNWPFAMLVPRVDGTTSAVTVACGFCAGCYLRKKHALAANWMRDLSACDRVFLVTCTFAPSIDLSDPAQVAALALEIEALNAEISCAVGKDAKRLARRRRDWQKRHNAARDLRRFDEAEKCCVPAPVKAFFRRLQQQGRREGFVPRIFCVWEKGENGTQRSHFHCAIGIIGPVPSSWANPLRRVPDGSGDPNKERVWLDQWPDGHVNLIEAHSEEICRYLVSYALKGKAGRELLRSLQAGRLRHMSGAEFQRLSKEALAVDARSSRNEVGLPRGRHADTAKANAFVQYDGAGHMDMKATAAARDMLEKSGVRSGYVRQPRGVGFAHARAVGLEHGRLGVLSADACIPVPGMRDQKDSWGMVDGRARRLKKGRAVPLAGVARSVYLEAFCEGAGIPLSQIEFAADRRGVTMGPSVRRAAKRAAARDARAVSRIDPERDLRVLAADLDRRRISDARAKLAAYDERDWLGPVDPVQDVADRAYEAAGFALALERTAGFSRSSPADRDALARSRAMARAGSLVCVDGEWLEMHGPAPRAFRDPRKLGQADPPAPVRRAGRSPP